VRRDERGFTLLELLLALAIVGALLLLLITGKNIGMPAMIGIVVDGLWPPSP